MCDWFDPFIHWLLFHFVLFFFFFLLHTSGALFLSSGWDTFALTDLSEGRGFLTDVWGTGFCLCSWWSWGQLTVGRWKQAKLRTASSQKGWQLFFDDRRKNAVTVFSGGNQKSHVPGLSKVIPGGEMTGSDFLLLGYTSLSVWWQRSAWGDKFCFLPIQERGRCQGGNNFPAPYVRASFGSFAWNVWDVVGSSWLNATGRTRILFQFLNPPVYIWIWGFFSWLFRSLIWRSSYLGWTSHSGPCVLASTVGIGVGEEVLCSCFAQGSGQSWQLHEACHLSLTPGGTIYKLSEPEQVNQVSW